MTMNKTWGYKHYDHDWKSVELLLTNLIDIASKGGNYLLNVGPKPDGTIPQESIDRLQAIGKWMKVNGESIHGTPASPTPRPKWGRITKKVVGGNTTLYLSVFDWPADGKLPVGMGNEVAECFLLADPSRKFDVDRSEADGLTVNLTGDAPDEIASVVVLKLKGEPNPLVKATLQGADGRVVLSALDADIHSQQNTTPRVESPGEPANIGYWTEPSAWLSYKFQLQKPGTFDVVLETSATDNGSRLGVNIGDERLQIDVPNTGDYRKYAETKVGRVTLSKPGVHGLEVRPRESGWKPVNLRTVKLVPAE
jgi:alpha-L-fucosidase